MFDDLDEALRLLLIKELPIRNNEIDVQFNQPKREWSARLSRPTLNFYLYDLRENVKLRHPTRQWQVEGRQATSAQLRRQPLRLDLRYAMTSWATDPADEHRLLTRALMVLFRFPEMPDEFMVNSLRNQPAPISLEVAQPDTLQNPTDFWSTMDNEIRPVVPCTITMALDPFEKVELTLPTIQQRGSKFDDADALTPKDKESSPVEFWEVKGKLRGPLPIRYTRMKLVEMEIKVPVQRDGTFRIKGLRAGNYTLEVTVAGGPPKRHTITVPSREYIIEL